MKLTSRPSTWVIAAALGLGAAALGLPALSASAAATCPTVAAGTGTVTPPPAPGDDWSGCNLTGADLYDYTVDNVDLSNANLTSADLVFAKVASNLTDANFSDANLTGVNLTAATVTGAIMATATLDGVVTFNTTGAPASLPASWADVKDYIVGPTANLGDAQLDNVSLAGLDLDQAGMDGTNLSGDNITGTDFGDAGFLDVSSGGDTGTPASLPADWAEVDGYLVGPTAYLNGASLAGADLSGLDLSVANLSDANLDGANLSNATLGDLYDGLQGSTNLYQANLEHANLTDVQAPDALITDANLTDATLTGANLTDGDLANSDVSGADLSQTTLTGLQSGGMTGTAALPADWNQVGGYIIGPGANLTGASLSGLDLSGDDLDGANLTSADLTGADLTGADLTDGELASANLTDASLDNATTTSADFTGVTWLNTTCPDGSNSNAHDAGCFSPLDTSPPVADPEIIEQSPVKGWYAYPVMVEWNWTDSGTLVASECPEYSTTTGNGPFKLTASCTDLAGNTGTASMSGKVDASAPVVTVTGVAAGRMYAVGHVPAPGCATRETISGVGTAARLSVSNGASHGIGPFTATCAGALSVAGIPQASPVSAQYAVGYGFGGFIAPRSGGTITKSSRSFTVTFRLLTASGAPISAGTAKAFAWDQDVRVELTGPRIKTTLAWCGWSRSAKALACTIKIPARVRSGRGYRYDLTVQENVGTGWHTAPVIRRIANPEVIHFR
jgi:uncharacterized protein YjbI with pentapeptide repeats